LKRRVRKIAPTSPECVRTWRPTITFSSAVISANRRMFWKVRAMPAFATSCTALGWYGWPPSSKVPASGCRGPVSTLKKVVLPAPFGPISP
jgi:hypothetical protein